MRIGNQTTQEAVLGFFDMGESGAPLFTDRKGAGRIPLWIGMSRRRKQDKASAYGLTFP